MSRPPIPSTQGYSAEAPELLKLYERWPFAEAHHGVFDLIASAPLDVLDIGAGTGRDAAWFAARGDHVTAVEPTREMREGGMDLHPAPNITWVDDSLPELSSQQGRSFDLVWMSAVWMHFDTSERAQMMPVVAALMRPGAALMISLRHGPFRVGRRMFEVSASETVALGEQSGLTCVRAADFDSIRVEGAWWSRLWFTRPGR